MHKEERDVSVSTENPDEPVVLGDQKGLRVSATAQRNVPCDPHSSTSGETRS